MNKGYAKYTTVGEVKRNRYNEACQEIDDVIAALQEFKARGLRYVQISDGFFSYAFNMREMGVPNFDAPCTVLIRPVNRHPDHDGVTRETFVALQARQAGDR